MAATRDRRRGSTEEAQVFETVWRRYRQGETDLMEGGVPLAAVDRQLADVDREVIRKILARLVDHGILVQLDGIDPETLRSRQSFAPAALVDSGGDGR